MLVNNFIMKKAYVLLMVNITLHTATKSYKP